MYKANILVVDDDKSICEGVASVLRADGYGVDMVFGGNEALEIAGKNRYAIIVVDLMLPGISGIDLLKEIKNKKPDVSVIMITGYPSIQTAVQSIKLGAFDYIPKPFTPNELRSLVARALEMRYVYEEVASRLNIKEDRLVEISIPGGLYCIPSHTWVKMEEDGKVRIGIHHALLRAIKGLASIEFPEKNETRHQGEACIRLKASNNQIHRLWAPVSGRVIQVNKELEADLSRLMHDPYERGWLLLLEPLHYDDDIKNLVVLQP